MRRLCPRCERVKEDASTGPCPACKRKRERERNAEPARRLRRSGAWQKVRGAVVLCDGNACTRCGRADTQLEVHHVRSLKQGGAPLDPRNLVTLCVGCHREQLRESRAVF